MEDQAVVDETVKVDEQIGAGIWGQPPAAPPVADKPADAPVIIDEPVIDIPVDWLKKEFDIEDPTILKTEREELRRLKEAPPVPAEIKFENEDSRNVYEYTKDPTKRKQLREFLETQEQIENYASLPIDKDNAASIIKLQMKLNNKQKNINLSDSEIEFEYKQNYVAPKEPVQKTSEDDPDFEERMSEWKERVEFVETKRVIAAKQAQSELGNFKSTIVLPEIQQKQIAPTEKRPTPEEVEADQKLVNSFILSVENDLKNLNEISVMVKDEAVEIPISYTFSPEEKTKISIQLKVLAEQGFNSNAIFSERWVNDDKSFNVSRMVRDLAYLNSEDKITQKFANDAAAKRLKEYTKEKKNIHLQNGAAPQNGAIDQNKAIEEVEAAIWKN